MHVVFASKLGPYAVIVTNLKSLISSDLDQELAKNFENQLFTSVFCP